MIFAYFFTPQIFFYGVTSLAGAILNARGHFAAPMWTPVVNNVVVIAVTVAFMVIAGTHQTATVDHPVRGDLPRHRHHARHRRPDRRADPRAAPGRVQVAAEVRLQARRRRRDRPDVGLDVRLRAHHSGRLPGHGQGRQLGRRRAKTHGVGAGFSAYSYAWLLFQLPYAVIAISVITALLPRMSANAADRRYDLVRSDFSNGVRLGSVIVAPGRARAGRARAVARRDAARLRQQQRRRTPGTWASCSRSSRSA